MSSPSNNSNSSALTAEESRQCSVVLQNGRRCRRAKIGTGWIDTENGEEIEINVYWQHGVLLAGHALYREVFK